MKYKYNQSKTTWLQRYKKNKVTLENYKNFMFSESLTFESRAKLLEEISRLEKQQKTIEEMSMEEYNRDDVSSWIEKESIINKKLKIENDHEFQTY